MPSTPAAGDNARPRLLSHHRSLWAADWTSTLDTVCILDVNRQSRTASETIARNVRSQLGEQQKLVFGMKPRSTAFHA